MRSKIPDFDPKHPKNGAPAGSHPSNAVRLDGRQQRIDCGEVVNPERTDKFSFGCWFYSDKTSGKGTLFSRARYDIEAGGRGVYFEARPSEGELWVFLLHHGWNNAVIVAASLASDVKHWIHVVVTYDGSSKAQGVSIYIDGKITRTRTVRESLTGTIQCDSPVRIGARYGASTPLNGSIDEIRLYDRQLTDTESGELFSLTALPLTLPHPATCGSGLRTAFFRKNGLCHSPRRELAAGRSVR